MKRIPTHLDSRTSRFLSLQQYPRRPYIIIHTKTGNTSST
ncbi:hypothetical protein RSAG8_08969, partial [Rhizoctonia solani AG-8 WAC10335]